MSDPVGACRIRPMAAADLAAVVRIEQASFDTPWNREQFLAPLGGDGILLNLVLELATGSGRFRIAGYASAWVVAGEMQINNLAVAGEHRRQGHGARILRYLLEQAAGLDCSEVSLEVSGANQAAVKMYEREGFSQAGLRKGYYRGTGSDALILTRIIGIPF